MPLIIFTASVDVFMQLILLFPGSFSVTYKSCVDIRADNVLAALSDPIVQIDRVRLIDYGAASFVDSDKRSHNECYQANIIPAPEVILGHPWSAPVDIWSIGCLLFELVTNYHLFGQEGPYSANIYLQDMVVGLNILMKMVHFSGSAISHQEDIIYTLGTVQTDDVPGVAAFMRRCLTLDSASHASALELLNDKWLEDV
ncbi:kinase-like domain-containing protein [Suillus paluster]|uniref:kinase-like domain-containing protein n=1 Tax=Suillus paluster TaxID=48578 RepID=UPI001B869951|nr:kinase-like domain-containing protein [Suillus paluster]KAG1736898.1 kinase-like domain-containing protein [Suillus paluster]